MPPPQEEQSPQYDSMTQGVYGIFPEKKRLIFSLEQRLRNVLLGTTSQDELMEYLDNNPEIDVFVSQAHPLLGGETVMRFLRRQIEREVFVAKPGGKIKTR